MVVWGGITNSWERREVKGKREKERYTHLNAEFQRRARRDKKAFLSDQCQEIEDNNRMGESTELFKKIRDTKGIFYAKMGTIKDINGMDLEEAEDINKRWQEYTEELYKKDLHYPDNQDGVITQLESDILEWEVKWALGSITMNKASGGYGKPIELFQILKYDAMKVLHSICQQIWKTQQWPQDWKRSVFMPNPNSLAMPKNAQTTTQLYSSHTLVKQCSKFSKTGFNSMWTVNFQMFKLDLERQKNQISNCQYPLDHRKSKRVPEKTYTSPFLTMPKFLTMWTTTNCGKFFKRWEYQTIWPASWEICM